MEFSSSLQGLGNTRVEEIKTILTYKLPASWSGTQSTLHGGSANNYDTSWRLFRETKGVKRK